MAPVVAEELEEHVDQVVRRFLENPQDLGPRRSCPEGTSVLLGQRSRDTDYSRGRR